jgi:hypothetical protein
MAVSGMVTTFNLPNYVGELFMISPTETPFVAMIGGLNGGKQTQSIDFAVQYESLPSASQPAILEGASAPAASTETRAQENNCVQIFHESLNLSYTKLANIGQVAPIVAGSSTGDILGSNPVTDEMAHQTALKLKKIALDIEYTFINGSYARPADNASARKTRGILAAANITTVAAGGAQLDSDLFDHLLRDMFTANAPFTSPIIMCGAYMKQRISDAWGYAPADRAIGGLNIKQIETDFGTFGIVLSRHLAASSLLVVDIAYCAPVFLNIPGKGFLFEEELGRVGASIQKQIYGEVGLAYGLGQFHGLITGLATEPDAV